MSDEIKISEREVWILKRNLFRQSNRKSHYTENNLTGFII